MGDGYDALFKSSITLLISFFQGICMRVFFFFKYVFPTNLWKYPQYVKHICFQCVLYVSYSPVCIFPLWASVWVFPTNFSPGSVTLYPFPLVPKLLYSNHVLSSSSQFLCCSVLEFPFHFFKK